MTERQQLLAGIGAVSAIAIALLAARKPPAPPAGAKVTGFEIMKK